MTASPFSFPIWYSQCEAASSIRSVTNCASLAFLGSQRFFGSHADQVAFQFGQQRKDRNDNLGTHIVIGEINVLL